MRDSKRFAALVDAVCPCPEWKSKTLGMAFDGGTLDPIRYFVCMTEHIPREYNHAFVESVRAVSLHVAGRTVNTLALKGVFRQEVLKQLSAYAILTDVCALPVDEFIVQCWTLADDMYNPAKVISDAWEHHRLAREKRLDREQE